MQYEITRTTQETFRVTADDPKDALESFVPERDRAEEMTTIRLAVSCIGEGQLLTYADHPKFPDHKVEVTDEMLFIRAKNGDVVFSARLVQEDTTHDLEI